MAINYGHYLFLSGGMNDAFDPVSLRDDQYAAGINVVSRNGIIAPRPDMPTIPLEFELPSDERPFLTGRFQGAALYQVGAQETLVCVISGAIYQINLDTRSVRCLSRDSAYLDQTQDRCYFCQAETFMIVQDGSSLPVIIQGGTSWVGKPPPDGPVTGTIMAYGHGRLFTKVGPRAFVAGDIHKPNDDRALLETHEHESLDIGGSLVVGSAVGEITAMLFGTNYDTATGDGPLMVSGPNGIMTFRVDQSRDAWAKSVFAKTQVLGTGISGPDAWATMNSDTLFWSRDGLRSFAVLQAEVTNARRFINLTREARTWYENASQCFIDKSSMAIADGRLLMTVRGQTAPAESREGLEVEDTVFTGILALDFERTASAVVTNLPSPTAAFDALWIRMPITQLVSTADGCYCFGKQDGHNTLCFAGSETTGKDDYTPIQCRLFTKGFATKAPPAFEDSPFQNKKFEAAYLWPRMVQGQVDIRLWLAVNASPGFALVAERTLNAPVLEWDGAGLPEIGEPRTFGRVAFPTPTYASDQSTGRSLLSGYEFQFCLDWTGMMTFSRFLIEASQAPEQTGVRCLDTVDLLQETDTIQFLRDYDFTFYRGSVGFNNVRLLSSEGTGVIAPVVPFTPIPDAFLLSLGSPSFDIGAGGVYSICRHGDFIVAACGEEGLRVYELGDWGMLRHVHVFLGGVPYYRVVSAAGYIFATSFYGVHRFSLSATGVITHEAQYTARTAGGVYFYLSYAGEYLYAIEISPLGDRIQRYQIGVGGALTWVDYVEVFLPVALHSDSQFVFMARGQVAIATFTGNTAEQSVWVSQCILIPWGGTCRTYDIHSTGLYLLVARATGLYSFKIESSGLLTFVAADTRGACYAVDVIDGVVFASFADQIASFWLTDSGELRMLSPAPVALPGATHSLIATPDHVILATSADETIRAYQRVRDGDTVISEPATGALIPFNRVRAYGEIEGGQMCGSGSFIYVVSDPVNIGVSCLQVRATGEVVRVIIPRIAHETAGIAADARFVYAARRTSGLWSYSVGVDGVLTAVGVADQGGEYLNVWRDPDIYDGRLYAASREVGLMVYSVITSTGVLYHRNTDLQAATVYDGAIFGIGPSLGPGAYRFVGVNNNGAWSIMTYTINASSGLTWQSTAACGGHVLRLWSDGTFLFAACGAGGLQSFSINAGTGALTLVDTAAGATPVTDVWGDGTYLYAACGTAGIKAYSVDGSGNLTLVSTSYWGGNYYSVWGDGTYIYAGSIGFGIISHRVQP